MDSLQAKQAWSGRYGELWVNDHYLAEITEFKATVTLDKTEVKMIKHRAKGYKITGYTAKGSLKLHKVDSFFLKQMDNEIKEGHQPVFTIQSNISDPDSATGAERIIIRDATFDELILADWAVDKIGEESYNFTFSDWEVMDAAYN